MNEILVKEIVVDYQKMEIRVDGEIFPYSVSSDEPWHPQVIHDHGMPMLQVAIHADQRITVIGKDGGVEGQSVAPWADRE